MADVLEQAIAWRREGRAIAIAAVVATWGASPFPIGSLMVIESGGAFAGSVSGGCVESAVIAEARAVIDGARPKILEFGVSNETAWEVGLVCGGRMQVLLFAVTESAIIETLRMARAARQAAALIIERTSGAHGAISRDRAAASAGLDAEAMAAGRRALSADYGAPAVIGTANRTLIVFPAPWRIIAVGAVSITQALAKLAAMLDYTLVIVEPRAGFADRQPAFRGAAIAPAEVVIAWPVAAFAGLALDRQTAVVTLTHDPRIDDEALAAALRADCFYIGALGSRRTHQARLKRLCEGGFTEAELARIHAPVGLAIGARSPAEIALSIMAEITQVRHAMASPASRMNSGGSRE